MGYGNCDYVLGSKSAQNQFRNLNIFGLWAWKHCFLHNTLQHLFIHTLFSRGFGQCCRKHMLGKSSSESSGVNCGAMQLLSCLV